MNQRGFTLTELMIAAGLSIVVALAAGTSFVSTYSQYYAVQSGTAMVQDLSILSDYFTSRIQSVGGGSVRSFQSIWVENNCAARSVFPACNGTDRLTLISVPQPIQSCGITSQVSPGVLQMANSPCCLTAAMVNQPMMLSATDSFAQGFITSVDLSSCRLSYSPGQAAGNNSVPNSYLWNSGSMTLINVHTYYLSTSAHELHVFSDFNNNGVAESGEDMVIADQVYDMQVALGYDFNPADGLITDNGSTTDEVLYNKTGDTALGALGTFQKAIRANLLTVIFSITSAGGTVANGGTRTIQNLDGPSVTSNLELRSQTLRLVPRNNYYY